MKLVEYYEKGQRVWFDPGFGYHIPGEIIEENRTEKSLLVQTQNAGKNQIYEVKNLTRLYTRVAEIPNDGVDDMTSLSDLNEGSLLWNLRVRYEKNQIYTYVGSILIAVNPYKMFDIYNLDMVKKYEGQPLGSLKPHLFSIGSSAYSKMIKDSFDQVIVISGESGAGKTESTKLIMQYLAAVNRSSSNTITEQILEANPLLESFGNAKTTRNDNSSRFGKYLEVYFKDGLIIGAKISEYLLEKSRIVSQTNQERNYHIFYEMLSGLDNEQKQKYGLTEASKYFYLNQGGLFDCRIAYKDDAEDFRALIAAIEILGFSRQDQETIFKILACVLHIGNVYFNRKQDKNHQDTVEIGSDGEIKWVSYLLSINDTILRQKLTYKVTEARDEKLMTPLNIDQALDARDVIAKALYSRLFTWLVERINSIINKNIDKENSIAILDIFGFENFSINGFEQLCINYANETLQFYFNRHIFRLEQEEYAKEKINWKAIDYVDNKPCIDLISKKPNGILHVIDDESSFPRTTDYSLLEKLHFIHSQNPFYGKPRMQTPEFSIKHYADEVIYEVKNFLDKNRDLLRADVIEMLINSRNMSIAKMFRDLRFDFESHRSMSKTGRFITMKPKTPTVAAKFHDSLTNLIDTMSKCNPLFVRCIKPNNSKAAMNFEMKVVYEQLSYTGMLETIRIRKLGFPIRYKLQQFISRYRVLLATKLNPEWTPKELCIQILSKLESTYRTQYQIGLTKVFLRENLDQYLEQKRIQIIRSSAIVIQKHMRAHVVRKNYIKMRLCAILIQSHVRAWLQRTKYIKMRNGFIRAQAQFRMLRQRKRYLRIKNNNLHKNYIQMNSSSTKFASNSQISFSLLDIPSELAFVYSKLDESLGIHSDENITSITSQIKKNKFEHNVPNDLNNCTFNKYVQIFIKVIFSNNCIGSTVLTFYDTIETQQKINFNIIKERWERQCSPIEKPFLPKSNYADTKISLSLFKLILRCINKNEYDQKRDKALIDYIIQIGLNNSNLRDEIFVQIVNQTWENKDSNTYKKSWYLMSCCLCCFMPTESLWKYLFKYVYDYAHSDYKTLCQINLLAGMNSNYNRKYPQSYLEWSSAKTCGLLALEVTLPNNDKVLCEANSWTTLEEISTNSLDSLGIKNTELSGWSCSLNDDDSMGNNFIFDLISEMEMSHLKSQDFQVYDNNGDVNDDTNKQEYENGPFLIKNDKKQSKSKHSLFCNKKRKKSQLTKSNTSIGSIKSKATLGRKSKKQLGLASKKNFRFRFEPSKASLTEMTVENKQNLDSTIPTFNFLDSTLYKNQLKNHENKNLNTEVNEIEKRKATLSKASKLNTRYVKKPSKKTNQAVQSKDSKKLKAIKGNFKKSSTNSALNQSSISEISEANTSIQGIPIPSNKSDVESFLDDIFDRALVSNKKQKILRKRIKGGNPTEFKNYQPKHLIIPNREYEFMKILRIYLANKSLYSLKDHKQPTMQSKSIIITPSNIDYLTSNEHKSMVYHNNWKQLKINQTPDTSTNSSTISSNWSTATTLLSSNSLIVKKCLKTIDSNENRIKASQIKGGMEDANYENLLITSFSYLFDKNQTNQTRPLLTNNQHQSQFLVDPKQIVLMRAVYNQLTQQIQNQSLQNIPANNSQSFLPKETPICEESETSSILNSSSSDDSLNNCPQNLQLSTVPPPAPPLPQNYQQSKIISRPSICDLQARAKTVRIGRVRWPPPLEEKESFEKELAKRLEIQRKIQEEILSAVEKTTKTEIIKKTQIVPTFKIKDVKRALTDDEEEHSTALQKVEEKLKSFNNFKDSEVQTNDIYENINKKQNRTENDATEELSDTYDQLSNISFIPKSTILTKNEFDKMDSIQDAIKEEAVETKLHEIQNPKHFTYTKVNWTLKIRKEVFRPLEKLETPITIDLIFLQIINDFKSHKCVRIMKEDRFQLQKYLESKKLTVQSLLANRSGLKTSLKIQIIDLAKSWPIYFSRLFQVTSEKPITSVNIIAISHLGVRLVKHNVEKKSFASLKLIEFSEIVNVELENENQLKLITSSNKKYFFKSQEARRIKQMIEDYSDELDQNTKYVQAIRDYITHEDTSLLCFKIGDIIKLLNKSYTPNGWLRGDINGRRGAFPAEYVQQINKSISNKKEDDRLVSNEFIEDDRRSELLSQSPIMNHSDGHYSMLEFAMMYFRQSIDKYAIIDDKKAKSQMRQLNNNKEVLHKLRDSRLLSANTREWTWSEYAQMIKYTKSPISSSLLKHDKTEMSQIAASCFIEIMKFMGDYPLKKGQKDTDCIYFLLQTLHHYHDLKDEIYCQIIKQTTNNKSTKQDSCQKGWRLMSIICSYCKSSNIFKPYLYAHLESNAYDVKRPYNDIAQICLSSLRKTFKYGGRKNVPSQIELDALITGRISKRQMFLLPGGVPILLNIRSCTVVQDCIDQICGHLGIHDSLEQHEFSIYYVVEAEKAARPLDRAEYIFDVITELTKLNNEYYLIFKRVLWHYPLRLELDSYIDMIYNQVLPDFVEGLVLVVHGGKLSHTMNNDIALLGALQFKANDKVGLPNIREVKHLLPVNVLELNDLKPQQWVTLIHLKLKQIENFTVTQAKSKFLEVLQSWPLFGSTFFYVKNIHDSRINGDCIMAINKTGILFLLKESHETLLTFSFNEIISTRRYRGENNSQFVDLKYGNLMQHKVMRIESDQGNEITTLIGQYINLFKKHEDSENEVTTNL